MSLSMRKVPKQGCQILADMRWPKVNYNYTKMIISKPELLPEMERAELSEPSQVPTSGGVGVDNVSTKDGKHTF